MIRHLLHDRHDAVVVIGGGQAGLAVGHFLARARQAGRRMKDREMLIASSPRRARRRPSRQLAAVDPGAPAPAVAA